MKFALCAVSNTAYSFDSLFTYAAKDELEIGTKITVPFGRGNTARNAIVIGFTENPPDNIKEIISVVGKTALNTEMLDLIEWLTETAFCTYYDAAMVVIPKETNFGTIKTYSLADIKGAPILTPKQKIAVSYLEMFPDSQEKEIGVSHAVIKNLLEKGIIVENIKEKDNFHNITTEFSEKISINAIILTPKQTKIYSDISAHIGNGKPNIFLLYGITGSGKTSIFKKLIDTAMKADRTAMLLVPEIALTPQMLKQFTALFGDTAAVIHSGLSSSQRSGQYRRINNGDAKIVIGTRSAVFAPLENIGIIIIDEEQEQTYKSESSPRYNTIAVARKRCKTHNAVLLLASATPSLESYHYAEKGVYNLLELEERYGNSILPSVQIVNMSYEEPGSEISKLLIKEIESNISRGEQSILLLNRRGYHTLIMCAKCNQPLYCKDCSLPMTYHKSTAKLLCHFCGYTKPLPGNCPSCGYHVLKKIGLGTQKLEEKLSAVLPRAKILRMDADTITSKSDYERNFEDFRAKKYDIMLGTQMIGKGLDFPNVTLVGVISVDKTLYYGDFRAYERTFSLITQVIGRSGRGDKKGRAILQTYMPEHYVISLGAQQNYKEFAFQELSLRKTLLLPPYCDVCTIKISCGAEEKAMSAARSIFNSISENLKNTVNIPMKIYPPVPDIYPQKNGKYYFNIVIKCKNNRQFRDFIRLNIKNKSFGGATVVIDLN